jgi:hypothetical protein
MKENPNWNVNFSFSPLLQTMDEKIVWISCCCQMNILHCSVSCSL